MAKTKFICNSCGYESQKWYGRCPECSNWNTFEEVVVSEPSAKSRLGKAVQTATPQKISEIKTISEARTSTGFIEFDRVLGGANGHTGIVPGSVILLSGDPGIGKSTLLLQLALNLANTKSPVLYITGEESEHQVRMRAERIVGNSPAGGLQKSNLLILSTTDIDAAHEVIETVKPSLVILDSVQTIATTQLPGFAGSVPQIRYVTSRLVSFAKREGIAVFLVGHVTKEGIVAGPMLLSHMVDTVLYLEGEQLTGTRILRSFKNRFGDTSEVGIFVMEEKGLTEMQKVHDFFLNKKNTNVAGSSVAAVLEGSRPLLVEIQALTVPSTLSFPRRVSTGISDRRLELLLAVLQKHVRIPIDRLDVFVNVTGGLKIAETAVDLPVCLAIASSVKMKALGSMVAIGEVGLLGELKTVPNIDIRMKEAKKFGFKVVSAKDYQFLSQAVKEMVG